MELKVVLSAESRVNVDRPEDRAGLYRESFSLLFQTPRRAIRVAGLVGANSVLEALHPPATGERNIPRFATTYDFLVLEEVDEKSGSRLPISNPRDIKGLGTLIRKIGETKIPVSTRHGKEVRVGKDATLTAITQASRTVVEHIRRQATSTYPPSQWENIEFSSANSFLQDGPDVAVSPDLILREIADFLGPRIAYAAEHYIPGTTLAPACRIETSVLTRRPRQLTTSRP
jgi:hypothetical protein